MRISRLYLEGDYQANQTIPLPKEQAHYALTVLRLKNNFAMEAFNGKGFLATGKLLVTSRRSADFQIESITQPQTESPLNLTLVQGISKGDRMDYSIQKSVELGVTRIQPILTERCDVKLPPDKFEKRQQQWQAIAINACEQSGRTVVPTIQPIQTYTEWLAQSPPPSSQTLLGLVLDPYAQQTLKHIKNPNDSENSSPPIQLLIGPEGGLTEQEVHCATQMGLTSITLGPRILRTETAGPAVIAILQALWGDFSR